MTTPNEPPLLRELIVIPDSMSDSDFVLRLTEGVTDAEATMKEYVITDGLVENFDQALTLIKQAVTGRGSKAAYLHGSFGSGKSHFMAVLHALLRGEPAARRPDEFAGLLNKHDWIDGKKYLLVPYHLLGARSLEQRVLGGYITYVRKLHPEAPIPAVHRTDSLLEQMSRLRGQIGDEQFLKGLPGGGDEDAWGDPEDRWTSEKLDIAFGAAYAQRNEFDENAKPVPVTEEDALRQVLVSDLLQSWATGFFSNAVEDPDAYVSLDAGLAVIAQHAKDLGYDAIILFLDELILWLANSIGKQDFVANEVQKITNFVEGGDSSRAIPMVSFIARQRDLRELVGENVTGAVELGFQDNLDLARGRFDTITLEDRNLPVVARTRVLRRVEPQAESDAQIAAAFEKTANLRREVWDTLLGVDGGMGADLDAFRKTYPFSPAFLDTLVHVSSVLQRSRTALKLMRKILINRRDDLRLGQLIPLGDLYDVLVEGGEEPFTQKLATEFKAAQKLYQVKLRPFLLEQYKLDDATVAAVRRGKDQDPQTLAAVRAFTGDDRLVKTLLLSALAPTVPALRDLTVRRLAALNHGSIISPIPGGEVSQVARKAETWAARFTEITFEKADDSSVGLELVDIDLDRILQSARLAGADSTGTRKHQLQRLLYDAMGVTKTGEYVGDRFDFVWKGGRRSIEIVFGNVRDERDLDVAAFRPADASAWRLILDYPFDEERGPADDLNRVQKMRASGFRARTVCWIPAAFSPERINDLRNLVVIDYVLQGQRFEEHAAELNPTDRHRAKETLRTQHRVLTGKLTETLRQAYGLTTKQTGDVVPGYDQHLPSLHDDLQPTLPMGGTLAEALADVAAQMLACQFPAHPQLDRDKTGTVIKPSEVKVVLEYVRKAIDTRDGRVEIDRPHRVLMGRIADPLRLGDVHEAAFVLGGHWRQHFGQRISANPQTGDLTVATLRGWLDDPSPMGLDPLLSNLVLACFAEQTNRAWTGPGGVLSPQPEVTSITDWMTLREQPLPDGETWRRARDRAMRIFGQHPPESLRARLAALFAANLVRDAANHREAAHELVQVLEAHADILGLDGSARLETARCTADLLDGLGSQHDKLDVITHLADTDLGGGGKQGQAERLGRSMKSAKDNVRELTGVSWQNLELISSLPEPHTERGEAILRRLRDSARDDELTAPLKEALRRAGVEASTLLREALSKPAPAPAPVPPKQTGPDVVFHTVTLDELDRIVLELRDYAHRNPAARIEVTWRVAE